jgi:uncharacterized membrane protein
MKLKVAQYIDIMLFALIMGVFWGTWFALSRSITSIAPQTFLDIGQTTIANLAAPMAILMLAALILCLGILLALFRTRTIAFYLTLAGFLCMIAALLITLLVNVPIDNQLKNWTVATLPADWQDIRERWELFHSLRTFISIASLALLLAGAFWKARGKI